MPGVSATRRLTSVWPTVSEAVCGRSARRRRRRSSQVPPGGLDASQLPVGPVGAGQRLGRRELAVDLAGGGAGRVEELGTSTMELGVPQGRAAQIEHAGAG